MIKQNRKYTEVQNRIGLSPNFYRRLAKNCVEGVTSRNLLALLE